MAIIRGYFDPANSGMSSQTKGNGVVYSGRSTSFDVPPQWTFETPVRDDFAEALAAVYQAGARQAGVVVMPPATKFRGKEVSHPHDTWFELVHILPREIDLGLITVDQVLSVEIYNAFRLTPRILSAFSTGAGPGVSFTDLPALPATIQEQDNLLLSLQVLVAVGPPIVDSTLDFTFDVGALLVPIDFSRAAIFPFEPSAPLVERLSFLTDLLGKRDGKEQRVSLRVAPRQSFDMVFELDGFERRLFDSTVFDSQARPLGVPVWFEPALLTSAVTAGATVLPVDSTAFADHRLGSFVIIFESSKKFEVQVTSIVSPTSITVGSPLLKSFPAGTRVMPVRIAFAQPSWRGQKAPANLQTSRVTLDVVDNDVDLSSTAAFGTFGGKVLLDEPNLVQGSLGESWERPMLVVDGQTGIFSAASDEPVSRRAHVKSFLSRTRQRLWEIRQALHALRGRQVSFYVPTFYEELVPVGTIALGGNTVDVENVGYTEFVESRQPRNVIRVTKKDGTKLTPVTVTGSVELSDDVERLTVSPTWSHAATAAEVARVEYFEEVRMDTDEVVIEHSTAIGDAVARVPVKAVLE